MCDITNNYSVDKDIFDFDQYLEKFAAEFKDMVAAANLRRNMRSAAKNKKINAMSGSIFKYIFNKELYKNFSDMMLKNNGCIRYHYKGLFNEFKSRPEWNSDIAVRCDISFNYEILGGEQEIEQNYLVNLPKEFIFEVSAARIEDFFYNLKRKGHILIEKYGEDNTKIELTHLIANRVDSGRYCVGFLLRNELNKFHIRISSVEEANNFYGFECMDFYCGENGFVTRVTAGAFENNIKIDIVLNAADDIVIDITTCSDLVETENNHEIIKKLSEYLGKILENIGSAAVTFVSAVDTPLYISIKKLYRLREQLAYYLIQK